MSFWKTIFGAAVLAAAYDTATGGDLRHRFLPLALPLPTSWTSEQRTMAALILRRFATAGWPPVLGYAALVNAFEESKGLQAAIQSGYVSPKSGDREDSWGLFQVNRNGKLGRGRTVAELQNPDTNTTIILGQVANNRHVWQDAWDRDLPLRTWCELFTVHVEEPGDAAKVGERRAALCDRLFPSHSHQGGRALGGDL